MSTKIDNDSMAVEIDGRVIATAGFGEHAAADGHDGWITLEQGPSSSGDKPAPWATR